VPDATIAATAAPVAPTEPVPGATTVAATSTATATATAPAPVSTPTAPARTASILSVSTELPPDRVTSAELADRLGITEDWILTRTGIRERRRAAPDDRLADYAARAGATALARAGVQAADVDLVLVATLSQDELTPNTAPLVAHALGAERAGAIDIGAACTAFLSGLAVGAAQIECGRADLVLLVGGDFITRITNYDDKMTAPLFADGAGAAVLGSVERYGGGSIGPIVLGADGAHARTIFAEHDPGYIEMDGPEVFRHAVNRMSEVTVEAIARAGLTLDEIDLFVYHQANARITRAIGERLNLPPALVVDCIETLGNTSAATLPIALTAAEEDGRLRSGARVLLCAFGAGFTWGAGVIEWGGA
jgi:3-oxoacyl-[acyl-carrier-protein] synthase-3